ncbi:MAG: family 16 glycoside hydrolase [Fibrobacteria bacterium]
MKYSSALPLAVLIALGTALAQQPPLSIPVVNHPCEDGPKMVGGKAESVETPLDSGFISIFNGTDLKGWWEDCATHTTDTKVGGVWFVDPSSKLLYSREEGQNGDILVTNQNYDHYEFIIDLWPTYGNDAGVFNRTTKTGKAWQTVVDYIQGSGVGGSYNERSWAPNNINEDPFKFGSGGVNAPDITTWTSFTKSMNPASFGCSANGCISSDFPKVWNTNGWNQLRIKFYGGLNPGEKVTMETWIRKIAAPEVPWVPVYKSEQSVVTPAAPIALQMHGGGRWKAGTYNIYRNIKVRPLDKTGNLLTTSMNKTPVRGVEAIDREVRIENGMLLAKLDKGYTINLRDARGGLIESVSAPAGEFKHALPQTLRGIFFAELKGYHGIARFRLLRI